MLRETVVLKMGLCRGQNSQHWNKEGLQLHQAPTALERASGTSGRFMSGGSLHRNLITFLSSKDSTDYFPWCVWGVGGTRLSGDVPLLLGWLVIARSGGAWGLARGPTSKRHPFT